MVSGAVYSPTRHPKPMKKQKLEIEYKIGLVFYILLIVGVLGFIGCQHIEKRKEQKQIEKEVQEMLTFPNLAKITVKI